MTDVNKIVYLLGKMKDLKRSGWVRKDVPNPESVADHSFGLAMLAFLLTPEHLDRNKCIKMALIHDLAEIYVGDITPFDRVAPEAKHNMEKEAMDKIAADLNCPEIAALFEEYEADISPEAHFMRNLDRAEAILQACYYDDEGRAKSKLLPEFFEYAEKNIAVKNLVITEIFEAMAAKLQ